MEKQIKSITTIALVSGLILLSASYVVPFQNWILLNASVNKPTDNQRVNSVFYASGIRGMVSENSLTNNVMSSNLELIGEDNDIDGVKKQALPLDLVVGSVKTPFNNLSQDDALRVEEKSFSNTYSENLPNQVKPREIPLLVELEDEVLVEFSADYSKRDMQKALSRLLVLPERIDANRMVATEAINTRIKPYLYGRVLNEYKKPIRYPAQAFRYAESLILNHSEKVTDEQGDFVVVSIPLTEYQVPNSVKSYQAWVNQYANQYGVSAELIFAIMHVESAFNPKAVSQSNALGLMQIKAGSAGRDVYKNIDQRAGQPTKTELFNPKENIRLGTAYVSLLNNVYLKDIRNSESRELLTISSYNGGISTVLKLFGATPEKAVNRINQLHPRQVYRTLRYKHQSDETKRYIEKVTQAKNRYKELLNFAA
ncbi:membrane-bound lytic murein transglycosylase C [Thiomicrorhabdus immobilis]|uniref:Membrane-bound lytic murein transglycosylase C n=1 Tax=Thiomicrorhabdus immobilis TaxID=2791037 RepID=A0ABN6CZ89_9GAMM|nr:murein transglycosylase domain-containing protein [Thiomicrorhabdus immobilis]BCN92974.1 membrane-bound lytic murein transglycosylase C [Thiomicrorhabdus immobilis]